MKNGFSPFPPLHRRRWNAIYKKCARVQKGKEILSHFIMMAFSSSSSFTVSRETRLEASIQNFVYEIE